MAEFKKLRNGIWEIEKEGTMRVPARIIATEKLLKEIEQGAIEQLKNTATLPGIQKYVIGQSDMHLGYGFPIGGVAAFDAEEDGIVSPGGIGFDINCIDGNTKILTENGLKKISDFELGNEKVATVYSGRIHFVFPSFFMRFRKKNALSVLTGQGNRIVATGEHPFLTKQGMVKLQNIKEGSEICTFSENSKKAEWDSIEKIKEKRIKDFVYDFTIPKTHNFIAGNFVVSNCGVRLVRTNLSVEEIKPKMKELLDILFSLVPAGVGGKGKISLNETQLKELLQHGASWAVENSYGWEKDLKHIEENGEMKEANPEKVSQKAIQRGKPQSGTLGSGNHFLEIQRVQEIFDEKIAKKFGLFEGQAVVMLHSGSRGLGHQIATDYIEVMINAMKKYGISVPDKQLACAPIESTEGKDYLAAMNCGVNYAFANRQAMTHWLREGFSRVLGQSAESLGMDLVYDICHNVAKFEEHEINGEKKEVLVHRKGATRAMPANRRENPPDYLETGHPAIIPGSMGTASYVLVGTEFGLQETFASVAHGAGRTMSRASAMKSKKGEQVKKELEAKGEIVKGASWAGLAEEAPEAYKDIDEVIKSIELAGIGKKIAKMVPLAVMKG